MDSLEYNSSGVLVIIITTIDKEPYSSYWAPYIGNALRPKRPVQDLGCSVSRHLVSFQLVILNFKEPK